MKFVAGLFIFLFIFSSASFSQDGAFDRRRQTKFEQIKSKLEKIENLYISKLPFLQRREAIRDVDEILIMLQEIERGVPRRDEYLHVIGEQDFDMLINSVKKESFDAQKQKALSIAALSYFFSLKHLLTILDLFTFSAEKIKAIETIYPKVVDKQNSYLLINQFTSSFDKDKVQKIIEKYNQ